MLEKFREMFYENIGKKLKSYAFGVGVAGLVLAVLTTIFGLIVFVDGIGFFGIFVGPIVGALAGVISALVVFIIPSMFIYAYGQLVQDTHEMKSGKTENVLSDELPSL